VVFVAAVAESHRLLEYWPEYFADTPNIPESMEAVGVVAVASCMAVVDSAEETVAVAVAAAAAVESHLLEYHP
jgi:hypothetical protein